jgi:hypothetical protein
MESEHQAGYQKYPLVVIRPATGPLADGDVVNEILKHLEIRPRILDIETLDPKFLERILKKLRTK